MSNRRPSQDEFSKVVRSLNADYGLHIRGPDVTVSPSKRRLNRQTEEETEAYQLYERLRVLHFGGQLAYRLGKFKQEAPRISRAWVDKPLADSDTLPEVSAPLGASSHEERAALRGCLGHILADRVRPSKRASDECDGPSSRRTRGRFGETHGDVAVDSIPMRSWRREASSSGEEGLLIARSVSPKNAFLNSSANTSKTSLASTIFSTTPGQIVDDTPNSSQITNWKPTQEYAPGTQDLQALQESFTEFEPGPDPEYESPRENAATPTQSNGPAMALRGPKVTETGDLEESLEHVWPKLPVHGLNEAPIAVIWEVTRLAVHCEIDPSCLDLNYDPNEPFWHDQSMLRAALLKDRLFAGKTLPSKSEAAAWMAALHPAQAKDRSVVFSAELSWNTDSDGPIFELRLNPLSLRLGHRLERRFGSDRFLEILMPTPSSSGDEAKTQRILGWLCNRMHCFLGRTWEPFFTKPTKKQIKGKEGSSVTRTVYPNVVYFFATNGNNFLSEGFPSPEEAQDPHCRRRLSYSGLLKWAINVEDSAAQPVPKLFSRIALSLSRTHATVVLSKSQIYHRQRDLESAPNADGQTQVMNDGIGRMSRCLARQISSHLALQDVPSAIQGRLGSAKGVWIIDVDDDGLDGSVWIETYPSQRKWKCNDDDPHHRTFEVRDFSRELRPAFLNQQFIPILEAQSKNPMIMRRVVADHLRKGLNTELDSLAASLDHPSDLRLWMQQAGMKSKQREFHGHVPFLGGLPSGDEDRIGFLLATGFGARDNQLLTDLIWNMQKRKTEKLEEKMNIQIPCSAYALMVVDFAGVLQPNEVHLSFSSKFQVDGFSDTLLDGMDILVARSPAHFPSDIQRVRVVCKPRLLKLKDVIVFPTTGTRPLADLLSGGDYDGDRVWICWDQALVNHFASAPPPPDFDFIKEGYLTKHKARLQDLIDQRGDLDDACRDFRSLGMSFNMEPSLLGRCTKYKEKLCYHKDAVNSKNAVALSTLLSNLVDQAKAGIVFTEADWRNFVNNRLKRSLGFPEPEYTKEKMSDVLWAKPNKHVLDHLKFEVAKDTIEKALKIFSQALETVDRQKRLWDHQLARPYHDFERRNQQSTSGKAVHDQLRVDLEVLATRWKRDLPELQSGPEFEAQVKTMHEEWLRITPRKDLRNKRLISQYNEVWTSAPDQLAPLDIDDSNVKDDWSAPFSRWQLIKASFTFKLFYRTHYKFVWWMAGAQLAEIKTQMYSRQPWLADTVAFRVVPEAYASFKPDRAFINAQAVRRTAEAAENESIQSLQDVMDFDEEGTVIDDL